jgi:uncharacterized iron-regulated membrane protein
MQREMCSTNRTARKIRTAFVWIHLCLGLMLSAYAAVIGTSGSILVFREKLVALEFPEFFSQLPASPASVTSDQALAAVRRAFPSWGVLTVTWPHEAQPRWMIYAIQGREAREIFVDPGTGQVAGARDPASGWSGSLLRFHANFHAGRTGSVVNGCAAWMMAALAISGVWLWLSGTAGPRLIRRLHFGVGVAAAGLVFLFAITGAYFVWPAAYVRAVDRIFARSPQPPPVTSSSPPLSLVELSARARAAIPDRPVHRVQVADGSPEAVRVTLREGAAEEFHRVSTVFLDPSTGAVLGESRLAARPFGDSLLAWLSVAHFGAFGGLTVRICWATLGLVFPLMSLTGFLMWWRRVVAPRRLLD